MLATALLVLSVVVVVAFGQSLAHAGVVAGLRIAGIDARFVTLNVGFNALHATGVELRSNAAEPIASIASIDLRYSVRDLLPGGKRIYGLSAFDVERPRITVIRHKDGTWNIPIPKQTQNGAPSRVPFIFDGIVRDGSVEVYDRAQGVAAARHLAAQKLNCTLHVATNARTRYTASALYVEDGQAYPIVGRGDIDTGNSFATQQWTATHIPIARIVDFALNSPSMHVATGELHNVDARIVGLRDRNGSIAQHLSVTADLADTRLAIGGLAKPLRDVHGPLAVYGDGLLLHLGATIAGVPITLGGGIFNLAAPAFRLTIHGSGDLGRLRQALAQTSSLPLRGPARLDVLVEGTASKPLIFIALQGPHATYRDMPFDRPNGLIAFDGQEADIVDFHMRYASVGLRARGRLALHPKSRALQMIAGIDTPPNALPYVSAVVPGMPLHALILSTGDTLTTADTRGIITGSLGARSLSGTFNVSSNGTGILGPLAVRDPHEHLYAIASIDHPHDRMSAYLDATHVRLATRLTAALPGFSVPAAPPLAATLDGRIFSSFAHGRIAATGVTNFTRISTPYGEVARASVRFGPAPRSGLAVALDASGIGSPGAQATAMLNYRGRTVEVRDAAVSLGATFVNANGSVENIGSAPAYDFATRLYSADLTSLVALADPARARMVEGSADAAVSVRGTGSNPVVDGVVKSSEGAVNGLAFSNLRTKITGTPARLALRGGAVSVGGTAVAFFAEAGTAGSGAVAVHAPRADLADFNDFFDTGDTLAGEGHIDASVAFAGSTLTNTKGNMALRNARFRSFQLGTTAARWQSAGQRIDSTLAFGGENGRVSIAGSVTTNGSVDLYGKARAMNLAQWLPMAGVVVPVTGLADADVQVAGRYPDLDSAVHAQVANASVGRVRVRQAAADATLVRGRGRLSHFLVDRQDARVTGEGTFGLHPSDALALAFRGSIADIGTVARDVTGNAIDAAGSLNTTLRITGTRTAPEISDDFTLAHARYGRFTIPRATGVARVDQHTIELRSAEVDLEHGRILASAHAPIALMPFAIDPHNRPISATLIADDVEASNVAQLLPPKTKLNGRVDGRVTLAGSVYAPKFDGLLTLADASFSGPVERVPITSGTAQLAFSGTTVTLRQAHANVGGGTLSADGQAFVRNVHDLGDLALVANARTQNATLDLPAYIKGRFDADLHLTRAPGSRPLLGGTAEVSHARIPLTALYNPQPAGAAKTTPPDIGFGLHVLAGPDVRVTSPNVDVGATGALDVAGTLAAPTLDGTFTSTGGTVSFFRTFRIEEGTVRLDPADGIIPTVDALATTTVPNPSTDVVIHVTGPATALKVAFTSDPPYDRAQILGLLVNAQAFGAVQGVASTPGSGFSASSAVSQLAAGQMNQIFTRSLLEPLSVALGSSLGLQNFQITNDLQSGVGVNATKAFGKNLSFVFADTFGYPRRQSWSLRAHPNESLQYEITTYTTTGQTLLGFPQPVLLNAMSFGDASAIPLNSGGSGFDVRLTRTYP